MKIAMLKVSGSIALLSVWLVLGLFSQLSGDARAFSLAQPVLSGAFEQTPQPPTLPVTLSPSLPVTPTLPLTVTLQPLDLAAPLAPFTVTLTVTPTWWVYFPYISYETPTPTPMPEPQKLLVCSSPNLAIPDNTFLGVTHYMDVTSSAQVVDLRVYVHINHTWVGDVTARVEHLGSIAKLLDRPGVPDPADGSDGCGQANIRTVFDDGMQREAEPICFGPVNDYYTPPAVGGSFKPLAPLAVFSGQPAGGAWGLRVVDEGAANTGNLVEWCLDFTVLEGIPAPTPTPPPVSLPDSAYVNGMTGQYQMYLLDCETRSAVDWAKHWVGSIISEYEFFWGLPNTSNPETGFVGNVQGTWGQVPPNDYGVHAEPIAARLRYYGLNAEARKYMRWDDLRAEIAAGRPVIVWIQGTIWPGAPRYYNPGSGPYTVTSPYEHTMVLVGYSPDTVWLLNGSDILTRSLSSFLDSWSALSNMGVIYVP